MMMREREIDEEWEPMRVLKETALVMSTRRAACCAWRKSVAVAKRPV